MRIETCEDGSMDVFVRQSWINEAVTCPERGRFGIIDEEASLPNDATVLGTAVHGGIAADLQAKLDGAHDGLCKADAIEIAYATWATEAALPMRWVKYNAHQIHNYIPALMGMYYDGLRRHVINEVVAVEKEFVYQFDTFTLRDGRDVRVWAKGTIDYVGNGAVPAWDWKTAGQPYKAWEKQRQAVQPTVYAGAVVALGYATWPVRFNYGVMVRDKGHQIVPVERNLRHLEWARMEVRPFIHMALTMGTTQSWPRNDTHFLCSEKWCSWWGQCKGAAVTADDMVTIKLAA